MTTGNITVQHDKPQSMQSKQQQPRGEMWDPSRVMRALLAWDPFRELSAPFPGAEMSQEMMARPAFDVKDTPEAFVFHADVPGMKENDIQVQFHGNRLTVSGKRESEQRKQEETYYTYERSYGTFARTFTLPESADADKASAEMKDGVLTITVPKRANERPRNVAIKSGASQQQPKS